MKFIARVITSLLVSGILLYVPAARSETTIVIVRHGEKPAQGLGQLSCRGLNRALALPGVLLPRYGKPAAIYAPNPAVKKIDNVSGLSYAYVRPLATIEPTAIHAGLPVNVEWGLAEIDRLAERLARQDSGTYFVAWEHHYGEQLAKELLVRWGSSATVPTWEDADFDSIYVIRVTGGAQGERKVVFAREQEGLNGQPESCDR